MQLTKADVRGEGEALAVKGSVTVKCECFVRPRRKGEPTDGRTDGQGVAVPTDHRRGGGDSKVDGEAKGNESAGK